MSFRTRALAGAGAAALAVICLQPTAPAAAASAGITSYTTTDGITYVKRAVVVDPLDIRTIKAGCPNGLHVLSGGPGTDSGDPSVRLLHQFPYDSGDKHSIVDDGWAAQVLNTSDSSFVVSVVATCSKYLPDYRHKSLTLTGGVLSKTVSCATSSQRVTAGGSTANIHSHELTSFPRPDAPKYDFSLGDLTGSGATVSVFAVCVGRTLHSVVGAAGVSSQQAFVDSATCAGATPHAVGGGFFVSTAEPATVSMGAAKPIDYDEPGPDEWQVSFDNSSQYTVGVDFEVICVSHV